MTSRGSTVRRAVRSPVSPSAHRVTRCFYLPLRVLSKEGTITHTHTHTHTPVHEPWRPPDRPGFSQHLGTKDPPKVVLMTVQPIWVIMGESFIIECRVPDVAPLEKLTLTLLRGNESLHRQTFEGATATPQEAMTTYNRTAHREDEHYNFSCQAELDLQSRGGKIIRTTSESQGLKIHEPKQSKQMLIVIVAVSVLLLLFVTSVLLCFIFGQQWHQRRRGSYGVQAAWRRLRRAYRA
ncbi:intercellular adhesion molecule 2 isoform X2 [Sturnira hondurensis]|uniref:intercellular adhesion molecule 2 isoform X2 n=1 Tax=Sturnira hondurensis TaxID=192404 RepID=UPI00187A1C05|nr:intercellular adhesion molecule 2 isoform X2 [Sturnira hondurensis]